MANTRRTSPDHRVCPGVSHVAMCGLRWQNGMHFGNRRSKCEVCENAMDRTMKRTKAAREARAAAVLKRSEAYYRRGGE